MPVRFHADDVSFNLRHKRRYRQFLEEKFFALTGKQLDIHVVFCSDLRLLEINRQFLQHDFFTDIITFPLHEDEEKVTAELYLSIDRIQENAIDFQVPGIHEFNRVLFHGVLHLCGLKDKTATQQKAMREAEEEWLKSWAKFISPQSSRR